MSSLFSCFIPAVQERILQLLIGNTCLLGVDPAGTHSVFHVPFTSEQDEPGTPDHDQSGPYRRARVLFLSLRLLQSQICDVAFIGPAHRTAQCQDTFVHHRGP